MSPAVGPSPYSAKEWSLSPWPRRSMIATLKPAATAIRARPPRAAAAKSSKSSPRTRASRDSPAGSGSGGGCRCADRWRPISPGRTGPCPLLGRRPTDRRSVSRTSYGDWNGALTQLTTKITSASIGILLRPPRPFRAAAVTGGRRDRRTFVVEDGVEWLRRNGSGCMGVVSSLVYETGDLDGDQMARVGSMTDTARPLPSSRKPGPSDRPARERGERNSPRPLTRRVTRRVKRHPRPSTSRFRVPKGHLAGEAKGLPYRIERATIRRLVDGDIGG